LEKPTLIEKLLWFSENGPDADAMDSASFTLCNAPNTEGILEADIKSCFDQISHDGFWRLFSTGRAILPTMVVEIGVMEKITSPRNADGTHKGGLSPQRSLIALGWDLSNSCRRKYLQKRQPSPRVPLEAQIPYTFHRYADDLSSP